MFETIFFLQNWSQGVSEHFEIFLFFIFLRVYYHSIAHGHTNKLSHGRCICFATLELLIGLLDVFSVLLLSISLLFIVLMKLNIGNITLGVITSFLRGIKLYRMGYRCFMPNFFSRIGP